MGTVLLDISMSLDGFITGPNEGLEHPLGEGGALRTYGRSGRLLRRHDEQA